MSKLGLGKGLSSLLGSDEGSVFGEEQKDIKVLKTSQIEPNKDQPRKIFEQETLIELSESIKVHGVISPIIVREIQPNYYQIIAGERRFRAAKLANLNEIPVRIIDVTDKQVAEISLIENLQREDLNPVEEALGYKELSEKYAMSQEEISKSVAKSRSAVANTMRLLALSDEILEFLKQGQLSSGHCRAILSVLNTQEHLDFANYIIQKGLNVRQAEILAKKLNSEKNEVLDNVDDIYIKDIEDKIEESLCRKVKILSSKNKKSGKIVLEYISEDDLSNLVDVLSKIKM